MAKLEYYTKTKVVDGKLILTKVTEEIEEHIIVKLKGNATITHVGGNGSFCFMLEGKIYQAQSNMLNDKVAIELTDFLWLELYYNSPDKDKNLYWRKVSKTLTETK